MKQKISLILETKTIEKSSNGKIFGNIYLSNEHIYFPEKDWNDFIVIILSWWVTSLIKLQSNQSIEEVFNFMDGSFAFSIKMKGSKLCYITCYDTATEEIIEIIENYSFKDINKNIFEVACTLEEYCIKNNWINEDIKELKNSISKYKSI